MVTWNSVFGRVRTVGYMDLHGSTAVAIPDRDSRCLGYGWDNAMCAAKFFPNKNNKPADFTVVSGAPGRT